MHLVLSALAAFAFQAMMPASSETGEIILTESSHQAEFQLVAVADGLASPWGLDFLPDGRLIITEWSGAVKIIDKGAVSAPLTGAPAVLTRDVGNSGMLDVAVHPDFARNQFIYLCFLHGDYESNVSRITRARLDGYVLRDLEVIFEGNDRSEEYHHSGCRLTWAEGGTLFATFGDRRHLPDEAQNRGSTTGSIIRIHDDGGIPADNPFPDDKGARPEIWAYGVRNVQGIAAHPETGALWFSEHGPLGGDEINILRRGANYGWPIATYGIDYDGTVITDNVELDGIQGPLTYWRPSTAPSGLAFYTGDQFPHWRGDLFMGSLGDRRLIRMELRGDRILFQEQLLTELDERIRDVRMGPDGFLYIVTDANPGGIYRLEPVNN